MIHQFKYQLLFQQLQVNFQALQLMIQPRHQMEHLLIHLNWSSAVLHHHLVLSIPSTYHLKFPFLLLIFQSNRRASYYQNELYLIAISIPPVYPAYLPLQQPQLHLPIWTKIYMLIIEHKLIQLPMQQSLHIFIYYITTSLMMTSFDVPSV